ncbi:MAG: hypothetical protein AAGA60_04330 [Cyanobacteria bacterium P01_E01_bin.42]
MAVKANQPKLFNSLNHQFQEHVPMSVNRQTEKTRDRYTQRTVSVLEATDDIDP